LTNVNSENPAVNYQINLNTLSTKSASLPKKPFPVVDPAPIHPSGLPNLNHVSNINDLDRLKDYINASYNSQRNMNLLGYKMKSTAQNPRPPNPINDYASYQKATSNQNTNDPTAASSFGPPTPISFLQQPSISNSPYNHQMSPTSSMDPYHTPPQTHEVGDTKGLDAGKQPPSQQPTAPKPQTPPAQPNAANATIDPGLQAVAMNYLNSELTPGLRTQALNHLNNVDSQQDKKPNFYQKISVAPNQKMQEFSNTDWPYINTQGAVIDFNYLNDTDYHKQPYANSNSDTVINFSETNKRKRTLIKPLLSSTTQGHPVQLQNQTHEAV